MALTRLQERIESLENQINESEIAQLQNANQKLTDVKCKIPLKLWEKTIVERAVIYSERPWFGNNF